jgi:LmbE family N-acetylglucosaminyl deacetylase
MSNKMTTHTQEISIKNKHTVLVVVAHTDDETLGLGGVISKHIENGDTVYGISMTDGIGARGVENEQEIKVRVQASINAGKILGLTWLEGGSFPDNAMDSVPLLAVVKLIEKAKFLVKPTLVYTHSSADLNVDHRVVSQATLTAFRPQPNEIWQEIRTFEIASATDYGHKSITNLFYPNLYVDITGTWEKKLAALNEYKMEMRDAPHARSFEGLENLAKHRGNQVGLKYAEAFEIIRKIER